MLPSADNKSSKKLFFSLACSKMLYSLCLTGWVQWSPVSQRRQRSWAIPRLYKFWSTITRWGRAILLNTTISYFVSLRGDFYIAKGWAFVRLLLHHGSYDHDYACTKPIYLYRLSSVSLVADKRTMTPWWMQADQWSERTGLRIHRNWRRGWKICACAGKQSLP